MDTEFINILQYSLYKLNWYIQTKLIQNMLISSNKSIVWSIFTTITEMSDRDEFQIGPK